MSDSEHPFDNEWSRGHVRRADTPRVHEAYRQMCELEGDIPPLSKGNLRFWPSDDDFRKAWRVDEEGIWLPQKLASDWPDIFWHHVVPRLDLESTLSLGQASVECRERVWGKVQAEHLHEKVLHNFLERSIVFEERAPSIVYEFDLKRPKTPVEPLPYACFIGNTVAIQALLEEAGDDVDKTGNICGPMYRAISTNQFDAILLLARTGFEITCDHLVFAVKYALLPAVTALFRHGLLQHGSSHRIANLQDENGNTVLHRMAMMDDEDFSRTQDFSTDQTLDILLMLLKSAGADRNIWNHDGLQAWHLSMEYPPGHQNENSTFAQTAIRLEML